MAAADGMAGVGQRWRLAATLAVTVVVAYYDRLNISFAIPLLAAERGWTPEQTGDYGSLLMGLFYVGYGLANLLLTPFAARLGPRRSLLFIVCLWALMTALGALASQVLLLFMASRVLLGITEGVHFPMMNALTKRWFPPHERSRANGLWISGIYVAILSAPLVLVPLMHHMGWRAGFVLMALAGLLLSLPLIARHVFDEPAAHPRATPAERDYLARHSLAEDEAQREAEAGGLARLFTAAPFLMILAVGIFNNVVALGLSGWLPTYLEQRPDVDFEDLRYLAAVPYLASFAGIATWSWLGDQSGRRAWIAGFGYVAAGACLYAAFTAATLAATVTFFSAAVFFVASFTATEFALVQRMLPASQVAVGAGVYNGLSTLIGGGLGPFFVKGVIADSTSAAALLPILVPCALIGLLLAALGSRLRY